MTVIIKHCAPICALNDAKLDNWVQNVEVSGGDADNPNGTISVLQFIKTA